jgi:hypothetical protein
VEWNETTNSTETVSILTLGTDYRITYKNNNNIGTPDSNNPPTITIAGIGAYKGKITKTFTINPQSLDASRTINKVTSRVTVNVTDMFSTKWKSNVIVKDVNGNTLQGQGKNADYVATYYTKDSNGELVEIPAKTKKLEAGTEVTVKVTAGAGGNYINENIATYRILSADKNIAKAKVSVVSIAYRGDAITLDTLKKVDSLPTITLNDETLVYGEDYVAVEGTYKNNVKKGVAKVTIKGISEKCGGTKLITYKITAKELAKKTTDTTVADNN